MRSARKSPPIPVIVRLHPELPPDLVVQADTLSAALERFARSVWDERGYRSLTITTGATRITIEKAR